MVEQYQNKKVAVIHLVWLPAGIGSFKKFIESYISNQALYPHNLVLAFNGLSVEHLTEPKDYIEYLNQKKISYCQDFYFQSGQDIDIYQKVAMQLQDYYLLFFNSYSVVNMPGWLRFYIKNFISTTGIISATASSQSYYSSVYQKHSWRWQLDRTYFYNFRKYKLLIKAFFYWRLLFKPFPNPHVRTNAFMVRREHFLAMDIKPLKSKFDAYLFESGRNSLTNYFLRLGLKVLVVDKHGKTYEPDEWSNSSTFWINNQQNLLVSDNQTTLYQQAEQEQKRVMTKLAWGI